MTETLPEQVRELHRKVNDIWTDLYGDSAKQESGLVQAIRSLITSQNRYAIILTFFSFVVLLNLIATIWIVLTFSS